MTSDLIETFKVFNGITNQDGYFSIFSLKLQIYSQGRFQKQSLLTNWIFC